MADPFGEDVIAAAHIAGIDYEVSNDVREHLPGLDVIYMNSIAFLGDSYRKLDSRFKLDASSPIKDSAVILHPLARLDELDTSLDKTHHNLYWSQAHGAVLHPPGAADGRSRPSRRTPRLDEIKSVPAAE